MEEPFLGEHCLIRDNLHRQEAHHRDCLRKLALYNEAWGEETYCHKDCMPYWRTVTTEILIYRFTLSNGKNNTTTRNSFVMVFCAIWIRANVMKHPGTRLKMFFKVGPMQSTIYRLIAPTFFRVIATFLLHPRSRSTAQLTIANWVITLVSVKCK